MNNSKQMNMPSISAIPVLAILAAVIFSNVLPISQDVFAVMDENKSGMEK